MADKKPPEGSSLDYLPMYLAGYSSEQVNNLSGKSGKDVIFLDYNDSYKKYVDGGVIEALEFQGVWDKAKENYASYDQDTFNGRVAQQWQYGVPSVASEVLLGLGPGDKLDIRGDVPKPTNAPLTHDIYGNQVATQQQVADGMGYYIGMDGSKKEMDTGIINNLVKVLDSSVKAQVAMVYGEDKMEEIYRLGEDTGKDIYKRPTLFVLGENEEGDPTWVETDFKKAQKQSEIRSALGPQTMTSNYLSAFTKGVSNIYGTVLSTGGSAAAGIDNFYDWMVYGEDKPGALEDFGNIYQNTGASLKSKSSQRANTSIFENGEAFFNAFGELVGQMGLQIATAGAGGFSGLSRAASFGLWGMMEGDGYMQEGKENNIDPMDLAWQYPIIVSSAALVEGFIGPNVLTKGTSRLLKPLEIRSTIKKTMNKVREEFGVKSLDNLTQPQKMSMVRSITKALGDARKALVNVKTPIGRVGAAGYEEGMEEVVQQGISNTVQTINDINEITRNPSSKIGDGLFGDVNPDAGYISNFIERIPEGMAEALVLGFLGGATAVGGRSLAGLNKGTLEEKTITDHLVAGDEKLLRNIVNDMYGKGQLGPTNSGPDGAIPTGTEGNSYNDIAYNGLMQDIDFVKEVIGKYNIKSATVINAVKGEEEFVQQATKLALEMEKAKQGLETLGDEESLTDQQKKEAATIRENLDIMEQQFNDITQPEVYTKQDGTEGTMETSKAYNDMMLNAAIKVKYNLGVEEDYIQNGFKRLDDLRQYKEVQKESTKNKETEQIGNIENIGKILTGDIGSIGKSLSKEISNINSLLSEISSTGISSEGYSKYTTLIKDRLEGIEMSLGEDIEKRVREIEETPEGTAVSDISIENAITPEERELQNILGTLGEPFAEKPESFTKLNDYTTTQEKKDNSKYLLGNIKQKLADLSEVEFLDDPARIEEIVEVAMERDNVAELLTFNNALLEIKQDPEDAKYTRGNYESLKDGDVIENVGNLLSEDERRSLDNQVNPGINKQIQDLLVKSGKDIADRKVAEQRKRQTSTLRKIEVLRQIKGTDILKGIEWGDIDLYYDNLRGLQAEKGFADIEYLIEVETAEVNLAQLVHDEINKGSTKKKIESLLTQLVFDKYPGGNYSEATSIREQYIRDKEGNLVNNNERALYEVEDGIGTDRDASTKGYLIEYISNYINTLTNISPIRYQKVLGRVMNNRKFPNDKMESVEQQEAIKQIVSSIVSKPVFYTRLITSYKQGTAGIGNLYALKDAIGKDLYVNGISLDGNAGAGKSVVIIPDVLEILSEWYKGENMPKIELYTPTLTLTQKIRDVIPENVEVPRSSNYETFFNEILPKLQKTNTKEKRVIIFDEASRLTADHITQLKTLNKKKNIRFLFSLDSQQSKPKVNGLTDFVVPILRTTQRTGSVTQKFRTGKIVLQQLQDGLRASLRGSSTTKKVNYPIGEHLSDHSQGVLYGNSKDDVIDTWMKDVINKDGNFNANAILIFETEEEVFDFINSNNFSPLQKNNIRYIFDSKDSEKILPEGSRKSIQGEEVPTAYVAIEDVVSDDNMDLAYIRSNILTAQSRATDFSMIPVTYMEVNSKGDPNKNSTVETVKDYDSSDVKEKEQSKEDSFDTAKDRITKVADGLEGERTVNEAPIAPPIKEEEVMTDEDGVPVNAGPLTTEEDSPEVEEEEPTEELEFNKEKKVDNNAQWVATSSGVDFSDKNIIPLLVNSSVAPGKAKSLTLKQYFNAKSGPLKKRLASIKDGLGELDVVFYKTKDLYIRTEEGYEKQISHNVLTLEKDGVFMGVLPMAQYTYGDQGENNIEGDDYLNLNDERDNINFTKEGINTEVVTKVTDYHKWLFDVRNNALDKIKDNDKITVGYISPKENTLKGARPIYHFNREHANVGSFLNNQRDKGLIIEGGKKPIVRWQKSNDGFVDMYINISFTGNSNKDWVPLEVHPRIINEDDVTTIENDLKTLRARADYSSPSFISTVNNSLLWQVIQHNRGKIYDFKNNTFTNDKFPIYLEIRNGHIELKKDFKGGEFGALDMLWNKEIKFDINKYYSPLETTLMGKDVVIRGESVEEMTTPAVDVHFPTIKGTFAPEQTEDAGSTSESNVNDVLNDFRTEGDDVANEKVLTDPISDEPVTEVRKNRERTFASLEKEFGDHQRLNKAVSIVAELLRRNSVYNRSIDDQVMDVTTAIGETYKALKSHVEKHDLDTKFLVSQPFQPEPIEGVPSKGAITPTKGVPVSPLNIVKSQEVDYIAFKLAYDKNIYNTVVKHLLPFDFVNDEFIEAQENGWKQIAERDYTLNLSKLVMLHISTAPLYKFEGKGKTRVNDSNVVYRDIERMLIEASTEMTGDNIDDGTAIKKWFDKATSIAETYKIEEIEGNRSYDMLMSFMNVFGTEMTKAQMMKNTVYSHYDIAYNMDKVTTANNIMKGTDAHNNLLAKSAASYDLLNLLYSNVASLRQNELITVEQSYTKGKPVFRPQQIKQGSIDNTIRRIKGEQASFFYTDENEQGDVELNDRVKKMISGQKYTVKANTISDSSGNTILKYEDGKYIFTGDVHDTIKDLSFFFRLRLDNATIKQIVKLTPEQIRNIPEGEKVTTDSLANMFGHMFVSLKHMDEARKQWRDKLDSNIDIISDTETGYTLDSFFPNIRSIARLESYVSNVSNNNFAVTPKGERRRVVQLQQKVNKTFPNKVGKYFSQTYKDLQGTTISNNVNSPFVFKKGKTDIVTDALADEGSGLDITNVQYLIGLRTQFRGYEFDEYQNAEYINSMIHGFFLDDVIKNNAFEQLHFPMSTMAESNLVPIFTFKFGDKKSDRLLTIQGDKMVVGNKIINDNINRTFHYHVKSMLVSLEKYNDFFNLNQTINSQSVGSVRKVAQNKLNSLVKKDEASAVHYILQNNGFIENRDYKIDGKKIVLGNAAMMNHDVYNLDNFNKWARISDKTAFRDKIFQKRWARFRDSIVETDTEVPEVLDKFFTGKQNVLEAGKLEATYALKKHPFYEAYFYGHHITNNSLNNALIGNPNQFASYNDFVKRGKGPAGGGYIQNIGTDKGVPAVGNIARIKDTDGVYKQMKTLFGDSGDYVATDGMAVINPLQMNLTTNSIGGEHSLTGYNDLTIKSFSHSIDYSDHVASQMKLAEFVLGEDALLQNKDTEKHYKKMLSVGKPFIVSESSFVEKGDYKSLYEIYEQIRDKDLPFNETWKQLADFIAEQKGMKNDLHDRYISKYIMESGEKINRSNTNDVSMDEAKFFKTDLILSELHNEDVYIQLNANQDDSHKVVTYPNVGEALIGVGEQNKTRSNIVDNVRAELARRNFFGIKNSIANNGLRSWMREKAQKNMDSIMEHTVLGSLLNDISMSMSLPTLKAQGIKTLYGEINKGIYTKTTGQKMVQRPAQDKQMYIGKDSFGNEVIRSKDQTEEGDTTTDFIHYRYQDNEGNEVSDANDVKVITPSQIAIKYPFMSEFGLKSKDSLNDVVTLKFKNDKGKTKQLNLRGWLMSELKNKYYDTAARNEKLDDIGSLIAAEKKDGYKLVDPRGKDLPGYYKAFFESLFVYGVRIPTTPSGMWRGEIMMFTNNSDNTISISSEKNYLDNSDYDIDQLNIYYKNIIKKGDSITVPTVEGSEYDKMSIEELQNKYFDAMMDYLTDTKNLDYLTSITEVGDLKNTVAEMKKNTDYFDSEFASSMDMFVASHNDMQGEFVLANNRMARMARLLSSPKTKDLLPGFDISPSNKLMKDGKELEGRRDYIMNTMVKFIQAAVDNPKELILSMLNINNVTGNIVSAMAMSNMTIIEIDNVLKDETVQYVMEQSSRMRSSDRTNIKLIDVVNNRLKDVKGAGLKNENMELLRDMIHKGEWLKRLNVFFSSYRGLPVDQWAIYDTKQRMEFGLGQTLDDFIGRKTGSIVSKYSRGMSNTEVEKFVDFENNVRANGSIGEFIRELPNIYEYIVEFNEAYNMLGNTQDGFYGNSPFINEQLEVMLKEQQLPRLRYKEQFFAYTEAVDETMIDAFLQESGYEQDYVYDLSTEENTIKPIEMAKKVDRDYFRKEFVSYINNLIETNEDFANNPFIKLLSTYNGDLEFQEAFNLNKYNLSYYRSEFNKLDDIVPGTTEMFEMYELTKNGFTYKKGSMRDVLTTDLQKVLGEFLKEKEKDIYTSGVIKTEMENNLIGNVLVNKDALQTRETKAVKDAYRDNIIPRMIYRVATQEVGDISRRIRTPYMYDPNKKDYVATYNKNSKLSKSIPFNEWTGTNKEVIKLTDVEQYRGYRENGITNKTFRNGHGYSNEGNYIVNNTDATIVANPNKKDIIISQDNNTSYRDNKSMKDSRTIDKATESLVNVYNDMIPEQVYVSFEAVKTNTPVEYTENGIVINKSAFDFNKTTIASLGLLNASVLYNRDIDLFTGLLEDRESNLPYSRQLEIVGNRMDVIGEDIAENVTEAQDAVLSHLARSLGPDNDNVSLDYRSSLREAVLKLNSISNLNETDVVSVSNEISKEKVFNYTFNIPSVIVKKGVGFVYDENPELINIGTQGQYSVYLKTIFPDSKLKDIVYHGTTEFEGEVFDKEKLASLTEAETASVGFHFSNKETATGFGIPSRVKTKKDIFTIPVLLNMRNKKNMENMGELRGTIEKGLKNPANVTRDLIKKGHDSIHIKSYQGGPDYIVFDSEQVHILGSKQDIQRFKKFIQKSINKEKITDTEGKFTSKKFLETVAGKLKQSIGIDYEIVNDPSKMVRGWFEDNKVFINLAHAKSGTPIHEYLHPFINAIEITNPSLFNNLESDIRSTPEGRTVINEVIKGYPEHVEVIDGKKVLDNNGVKEAMVRTITKLSEGKLTDQGNTLWRSIKMFFRGVWDMIQRITKSGVIKVQDIDPNMTLKDMSALIVLSIDENAGFKIDLSGVTNSMVAAEKVEGMDSNDIINDLLISNLQKDTVKQFSDTKDAVWVNARYHDITRNGVFRLPGGKEVSFKKELNSKDPEMEVKKKIKTDLLPQQKLIYEENINSLTRWLSRLDSEKEGFGNTDQETIDKFFGKKSFITPEALEDFKTRIQYDNFTKVVRYNELKGRYSGSTMKGITSKVVEGDNPLVIIHSETMNESNVVTGIDISLIDVNFSSINVTGIGMSNKFLMSNYITERQSEGKYGISLGNTVAGLKKFKLGLSAMKMIKENKDINIRQTTAVELRGNMKAYPIILTDLIRNIKGISKIDEFVDKLDPEIKSLLSDENLLNTTQSANNLVYMLHNSFKDTYYKNNKRSPVLWGHMATIDEYLSGKGSMQDMIDMLKERIEWLNNTIKDENERFKDEEYQLVSELIYNYQGLKRSSSNVLKSNKDATIFEFFGRNTDDLRNEIVQDFIALVQKTNNIVIGLYKNYKVKLKPTFEEVNKLFMRKNPGRYTLDKVRNLGQEKFEPLYIKEQVYSLEAKANIEVNTKRIHWDKNAVETKDAIANGQLGTTPQEVASWLKIGNTLATEVEDRVKGMLRQVEMKANKSKYIKFTKDKRSFDYKELDRVVETRYNNNWSKGMLPVMPKRAGEYFWEAGISKKGLTKAGQALSKWVTSEKQAYYVFEDVVEMLTDDHDMSSEVPSMFLGQFVRATDNKFGGEARMKLMGLDTNDKGVFISDNTKLDKLTGNIERVLDWFVMDEIWKEEFENNVMDEKDLAMVRLHNLHQLGGVAQENNKKIIQRYWDVIVKGVQPQLKNDTVYENFANYLNLFTKITTWNGIALSLPVAITSYIANFSEGISDSFAAWGSGNPYETPTTKEIVRAGTIVVTKRKKVARLGAMHNIIDASKYDQLNIQKYSVTENSFLNDRMPHIGNRITDVHFREVTMVAQMIHDGSWDAYNDEGVYDVKKDTRYYKADGTQTEEQEILTAEMRKDLASDGRTAEEQKGKDAPVRGYNATSEQKFRYIADQIIGNYDALNKPAGSHEPIWRAVMQFKLYFLTKWEQRVGQWTTLKWEGEGNRITSDNNRVLRGGSYNVEYDTETGKKKRVWVPLEKEGYYVTLAKGLWNTMARIKNGEFSDVRSWKKMTKQERYNTMRSIMDVGWFLMFYALYEGITGEWDDDKEKALHDSRLLRAVQNGFFTAISVAPTQLIDMFSSVPVVDMVKRIYNILTGAGTKADLRRSGVGASTVLTISEMADMLTEEELK